MSRYAKYENLGEKKLIEDVRPCMEVQDLNHRKKLLTENTIVVIDLLAEWCGPCKQVSPQFAKLAQRYNSPGKCILVKENVDLELTRDVDIKGIPAFLFYRRGQLMRTGSGEPLMVVGGDMRKIEEVLTNLLK